MSIMGVANRCCFASISISANKMSLRILITGAAGFVGAVVASAARERGHQVIGVDRRRGTGKKQIVVADITDGDHMLSLAEHCDAVIHCAAIVGPAPATADPVIATQVNVNGTLSLLEAARKHKYRLVCLSTATLYGNDPTLPTNDEKTAPNPVGIYDATKLMAETLCDAYRKTFAISVASIRTSFVYGPGHSTGEYFVKRCLEGETTITGSGRDHPCEFTYVKDLASGLVAAAEAPALSSPVYNIASGLCRTRGELADIVMSHFRGVSIDLEPGLEPGRHLRGPCSIERAHKDFHYSPSYGLESGIEDWLKQSREIK